MARKKPIWSPRDIVAASAEEARRSAKPKTSKLGIPTKRQSPGVGQATLMARFRDLPRASVTPPPVTQKEVDHAEPKPQAASARNKSADGATSTAIEVGARAIYEFRAHPKKRPWETISEEERAPYRDRMKRLSAAIGEAGFQIRRG